MIFSPPPTNLVLPPSGTPPCDPVALQNAQKPHRVDGDYRDGLTHSGPEILALIPKPEPRPPLAVGVLDRPAQEWQDETFSSRPSLLVRLAHCGAVSVIGVLADIDAPEESAITYGLCDLRALHRIENRCGDSVAKMFDEGRLVECAIRPVAVACLVSIEPLLVEQIVSVPVDEREDLSCRGGLQAVRQQHERRADHQRWIETALKLRNRWLFSGMKHRADWPTWWTAVPLEFRDRCLKEIEKTAHWFAIPPPLPPASR